MINNLFLTIVFIFFIFSSFCLSAGYKITKAIEIGNADELFLLRPLKWSPDGTKLSYFYKGRLMISDTLGKIREVKKLDLPPNRYEWLSNNELIIDKQAYLPPGGDTNVLVILDINSGIETILDSYVRRIPIPRHMDKPHYFDGPRLTVEGNVYYKETDNGIESVKIVGSKSSYQSKALALKNNHFIHWHDNGLYLVAANRRDSTFYSVKKPFSYMPSPTIINKDKSYLSYGGFLSSIPDSIRLVLDTFNTFTSPPTKSVGCSFSNYEASFNPNSHITELLTVWGCDIRYDDNPDHVHETFQIVIFNYLTYDITILDTLLGISNGTYPVYAPDGLKIAFLANKKAYIIYREME